jgi:hypothetical protein
MPNMPRTKQKKDNPSIPMPVPRRETFCQLVAQGLKVKDAFAQAGFNGKSPVLPSRLRWHPDINARVNWLVNERVKASAQAFARRQKGKGDLLARVVQELEDMAFSDVREVLDWKREASAGADGEVLVRDVVHVQDAKKLSPAAAKAIKSVFLKAGELRVDMHDKRAVLETLAKILTIKDTPVPQSFTVNQVNVGGSGAGEALQRVAFALSALMSKPTPLTIDATPVQNSTDTDKDKEP